MNAVTHAPRHYSRAVLTLFKGYQMGAYGNDVYDYSVYAPARLVRVLRNRPGAVTLFPAPARPAETPEF